MTRSTPPGERVPSGTLDLPPVEDEAQGESRSRPHRPELLVALATAVVAAVVAWLRLPPVARQTMWAEDGAVFVPVASASSVTTSAFEPYGGYVHLLPRLLAEAVVSTLPPEAWAVGVSVLSCGVAGLVAAGVLLCARPLVPQLPARLALAAVTVLAPLLPIEVLGNLANVHWLLLWLMPWLLIADARGPVHRWGLGVVTFVVTASEVQAAVFAPLLLWRRHGRGVLPRMVGLLAGTALQLHAVLTTSRPTNSGEVATARGVVHGWVVNAVLPWFLGTGPMLDRATGVAGTVVALLALGLGAACVVLVVRHGSRPAAVAAVLAPAAGLLLWATAVVLNTPPLLEGGTFDLLRYGYLASLLAVVPVVLAVTAVPWTRTWRVATALLLVPLVSGTLAGMLPPLQREPSTERADGPLWAPQVRPAVRACLDEAPPPTVVLRSAPGGWGGNVTCEALID